MYEKEQPGLRVIEEDIMEVLFSLHISKSERQRIKMGEILDRMEDKLTKAQLTNIVRRKLEPQGYVDYLPYEGVHLTRRGYQIAKKIARNHRLAEAMLYQIFEMPFIKLHEQACHLEHAISDEIAEYVYRKLQVKTSPFGMPIPMKEKDEDSGCEDKCLHEVSTGVPLTLTRIQDHSTEIAKKLKTYDISAVGTKMCVKSINNEGVVVEVNKNIQKIPLSISKLLCVKPEVKQLRKN
ncbi:MAG: metal-dependent transcriptional regulator [Promethearchaeota archaeon]